MSGYLLLLSRGSGDKKVTGQIQRVEWMNSRRTSVTSKHWGEVARFFTDTLLASLLLSEGVLTDGKEVSTVKSNLKLQY